MVGVDASVVKVAALAMSDVVGVSRLTVARIFN